MLLADVICQGYDGYNVFATDVIVTCMQWLMETTLFRDNNQFIVTDAKVTYIWLILLPPWQMLLPYCCRLMF